MPSPAHEVPLQLIHDHPALLASLLHKIHGNEVEGALAPVDANLRFADPAEVRPDLVFRAERPKWLLLELQNRVDPDKAHRWIMASAIQLAGTGVMGEVVILTSSRRVAGWAKRVARAHGDFGSRLRLTPIVLPIVGDTIDLLLDGAHPELAFFAAWAVRARRGPEAKRVIDRAATLVGELDESLRGAAARAIVAVLREPMLAYLRQIAMNDTNLPETRAGRRFRLFFEGRGKAEGLVEGKREGLVEGKRDAILKILEARGVKLAARDRATIIACEDAAVLDDWLVKAAVASSVSDVLGAPAKPRAARKAAPRARR